MDKTWYTDIHIYPSNSINVEIVAYQTVTGEWDVFVFEPVGSCPELEELRTDDDHIFIGTIDSEDQLDHVAQRINEQLGDAYEQVPYYQESGSRRIIGKITSYLQNANITGLWVRSIGEDKWQLLIRKKDFPKTREVIEFNVDQVV